MTMNDGKRRGNGVLLLIGGVALLPRSVSAPCRLQFKFFKGNSLNSMQRAASIAAGVQNPLHFYNGTYVYNMSIPVHF